MAEGLAQLPIKGLILEPVADDDCNLKALQREMETRGFSCSSSFRFYNWIYRVQGQSYEDNYAARPEKLRNTITRKQRKLYGTTPPPPLLKHISSSPSINKTIQHVETLPQGDSVLAGCIYGYSDPAYHDLSIFGTGQFGA